MSRYLTFSQRRNLADWMEKNKSEVESNTSHVIAISASADLGGCAYTTNHVLIMAKELGMKTGGRAGTGVKNGRQRGNGSTANQIVWLAKILRKVAKLEELTDEEIGVLNKIVARGSFASENQ